MGVEIEGDRLGLGTNLYSTQQTLTERFGIEKEEKELKRKSKLLNQMAQIDKKKYEEEIAAQTDPIAKAKAGKYNAEAEEIPITVKKVQYADREYSLLWLLYGNMMIKVIFNGYHWQCMMETCGKVTSI